MTVWHFTRHDNSAWVQTPWRLTIPCTYWLIVLWSLAHTSSTEACRGYCTLNCTGSMCPSESRTSSASWCTVAFLRSSASVLDQPLPTILRCRFSAAYQVRQSTTPGSSASPVANVRPTGFRCCWPIGLELIAWQFERSECHQRQLPQTFENTFVRSVLKHPAH